jgi:hypothetical protein
MLSFVVPKIAITSRFPAHIDIDVYLVIDSSDRTSSLEASAEIRPNHLRGDPSLFFLTSTLGKFSTKDWVR